MHHPTGSSLLSGSLALGRLARACVLWRWLNFHTSLQFPPPLVSRRPEKNPGGVGPCARQFARSSRRGGVKIDGAQVPRRSHRCARDGAGDLLGVSVLRVETKYIKSYYFSLGCCHLNLDHGLDGQVSATCFLPRCKRGALCIPRDVFVASLGIHA